MDIERATALALEIAVAVIVFAPFAIAFVYNCICEARSPMRRAARRNTRNEDD